MKTFFDANGPNRPRWQQRTVASLQRAWNDLLLQLVMAEHRRPPEPVLIPIRIEQPEPLRQSKRSTWHD